MRPCDGPLAPPWRPGRVWGHPVIITDAARSLSIGIYKCPHVGECLWSIYGLKASPCGTPAGIAITRRFPIVGHLDFFTGSFCKCQYATICKMRLLGNQLCSCDNSVHVSLLVAHFYPTGFGDKIDQSFLTLSVSKSCKKSIPSVSSVCMQYQITAHA